MNRRIAACAIAAATILGLTACGGGSDSSSDSSTTSAPTTPPAAATSAPAAPAATTPAEEPATGQTVSEACIAMSGPVAEAGGKMVELAQAPTDAQNAVDSWTALVDAFGEISGSVTNEEVAAAATTVYEDTTRFRDSLQKVYVEGDMTLMDEYIESSQDWSASYTALMELCSPATN